MKILLVEDNLMNQKVVMFSLGKLNCEIIPASNGKEALENFKKFDFDLVFMDIMLPDMNGYDITREIRKIEVATEKIEKVPIVALTANTYDNDKEKCFDAGMNDYLAKPFTSLQLISTVEKYMKRE